MLKRQKRKHRKERGRAGSAEKHKCRPTDGGGGTTHKPISSTSSSSESPKNLDHPGDAHSLLADHLFVSTKPRLIPAQEYKHRSSRRFEDKEQVILEQILHKARLHGRAFELEQYGCFSGFPPWPFSHRLGPTVFVTLLLPAKPVSKERKKKLRYPQRYKLNHHQAQQYRAQLYGIVEETLGEGLILGMRIGAHYSWQNKHHAHVLLSRLRFAVPLKAWASAFVHQPKAVQRTWLPFFFSGPHLDVEHVADRLREPYVQLLRQFFPDYTGDGSELVNVSNEKAPMPRQRRNQKGAAYLDNPWKAINRHTILGYYPHRGDREILVQQRVGKKAKFRISLRQFISDWLVKPAIKWFRRGGKGFILGQSKLSAVMDMAAKMPHPADPKKGFLDQEPEQMAERAARALRTRDPAKPVPCSEPVPAELLPAKSTATNGSARFPAKRLPAMLKAWPFLKLLFPVPPDTLTSWTQPDVAQQLYREAFLLIRRTLTLPKNGLGAVVIPQVSREAWADRLGIGVYVSCVTFNDREVCLLARFQGLPKDEQQRHLPAFFRHSIGTISPDMVAKMATAWRSAVTRITGHTIPPDAKAVRLIHHPQSLPAVHDRYLKAHDFLVALQMDRIGIAGKAEGHVSLLMEDQSAKSFPTLKALSEHLQHLRQPREPEAWGFFHNRDQRFGQIARQAIDAGRDVTQMQARGEAAFIELCRILKVDPALFRHRPLSERLGFGNAALSAGDGNKA